MKSKRRTSLSAGIVITRLAAGNRLFLLLRAFNYWDFPKGMVEKNETPLAAAIREVREETAITKLDFNWGEIYFETAPYSRGKIARYYLAETPESEIQLLPNPATGRPEHLEFRWVPVQQALDLVSPRVRNVIHWARTHL